ncbi:MAG: DNA-protecting protein DprA [Oscillospiraceae bacterium]|nr:DNA-protecting protein DprA [Oscillospiraceae bacterium]MBQ7130801.1 DNA-protecting protein DprA [Oscillospiraceae bacterium]
MILREKGFLLLCSHLGDPERRPLTGPQLRMLAQRARTMDRPEADRELETGDLIRLGYSRAMAERILQLLSQEDVLDRYLTRGRKLGCIPVTRISEAYPQLLRRRLGLDSPGCLWTKGDISLLNTPAVALVGSRELREENRRFAEAVGFQAARQGLTLVSGNARGADRAAQNACLRAGGRVISIVADELARHCAQERILYVSEDGFDDGFSAQRAISRNRCIHAMGRMVFVAQADLEKGGTWDGSVKNLKNGLSTVACFRDGSEAAAALEQRGAWLIGTEELADFSQLSEQTESLFDR